MKRLLTPALIAAGILCFLGGALYDIRQAAEAPVISLSNSDLYSWYMPNWIFVKESILGGSLPLWSPYQATGQPFLGEIAGALFYPFTWVIFLMDVPMAMLVIQFLDVTVALLGMVLYLRYLKLEWPSVVLGSVLVGYIVLEQTFNTALGSSLCWMPIIFWLTHRLIDKPGLKACAALSVSLAVCFFGGFPQLFYHICVVAGIYFFFVLLFSRSRFNSKTVLLRLILFGLAFLLMTGLVSFQLFHTMELSRFSVRSLDFSPPELESFSIASKEIWGWFFRQFGYSLLLIPFAFWKRKCRGTSIALTAGLAYTIIFFLSKQIPALAFFGKIPFAESFRIHIRTLLVSHFMAAVLAGIGLSALLERSSAGLWERNTEKINWFWIVALAWTSIFLYFTASLNLNSLTRSFLFYSTFIPAILLAAAFLLYALNLPPSIKEWGSGALTILAMLILNFKSPEAGLFRLPMFFLASIPAVLVLIAGSSKLNFSAHRLSIWVIAILILLHIIPARRFQVVVPAVVDNVPDSIFSFPDTRATAWAKENTGLDRILLTFEQGLWNCENAGNMFQLYSIDSYSVFTLARWRNFLRSTMGPSSFDKMVGDFVFYGPVPGGHYSELFLAQPKKTGLLSLRYAVIYEESPERETVEAASDGWKVLDSVDDPESSFFIYENQYAAPRAYLVSEYMLSGSEEESLQMVDDHLSEMSHSVILENGKPSFSSSIGDGSPGDVSIERYENNKIVLDVTAMKPCLLVLTESYYPGWSALVDGAEKSIWRANSLFRAVEISPGEHRVVFRYRPTYLILGTAISAGSLLIILLGLFTDRWLAARLPGSDMAAGSSPQANGD